MRRALSAAYRVGPLVVAFEADEPDLLLWAKAGHPGCSCTDVPDVVVTLVRRDESLMGPSAPDVSRAPDGLSMAYHGWRARYFADTRRCVGVISARMDAPARGPRRVASLTRVLVGRLLLERGGLAFHAAALVRGGVGHLFVGPRGVGKTTMATRWVVDRVLGDDHAIVTPGSRAAGPVVWSTPYAGREGTPSDTGSAPLSGIWCLEQSARPEKAPMTRAQAFSELVPNIIHAGSDPEASSRVLDALADLVTAVPVSRLRVSLEHNPWELVAPGREAA